MHKPSPIRLRWIESSRSLAPTALAGLCLLFGSGSAAGGTRPTGETAAAIHYGSRNAYYVFQGSSYTKFVLANGGYSVVSRDTPIIESWPTLPASWAEGFDAALYHSKDGAFFFKDLEFVRLDHNAAVVEGPSPIASRWPGFPATWSRVDAAFATTTGMTFFHGGEWCRFTDAYELATTTLSVNKSAWGTLQSRWPDGSFDMAFQHSGTEFVFLRGDEFAIYDSDTGFRNGSPKSRHPARLRVELDKVVMVNDSDDGAEGAGDLFWDISVQTAGGTRTTITKRDDDHTIDVASGTTKYFKDMYGDNDAYSGPTEGIFSERLAGTQSTAAFHVRGTLTDNDSLFSGGDDVYGTFDLSFVPDIDALCPNPTRSVRLNQKGDLALSFKVSYDASKHSATFVVLTDPQLSGKQADAGDDYRALMKPFIAALNDLGSGRLNWPEGTAHAGERVHEPDFFVFAGDLTAWGGGWTAGGDLGATGAAFALFESVYGNGEDSLLAAERVYLGMGNHDLEDFSSAANRGFFRDRMLTKLKDNHRGDDKPAPAFSFDADSGSYSWNVGGVHFIQANRFFGDEVTVGRTGYEKLSPEDQAKESFDNSLAWLAADLKSVTPVSGASAGTPVVIVQHYGYDGFSLTNSTTDGSSGGWWSAAERTAFENAIADYNVVGVFHGHRHTAASSLPTPRSARSTSPPLSFNPGSVGNFCFALVHVSDSELDVVLGRYNTDTKLIDFSSATDSSGSRSSSSFRPLAETYAIGTP